MNVATSTDGSASEPRQRIHRIDALRRAHRINVKLIEVPVIGAPLMCVYLIDVPLVGHHTDRTRTTPRTRSPRRIRVRSRTTRTPRSTRAGPSSDDPSSRRASTKSAVEA